MSEEKAIIRAQYLDLVYSQYDTLYELIPHAPCPTYDPSKDPQAHTDKIIGLVKSTPEKPLSKPSRNSNSTTKTSTKSTTTPTKTSDVNVVQKTPSKNPPPRGVKNKHKKKLIPQNKIINKHKVNLLQSPMERGKYDSHAWFATHYITTPKIVHGSKR